MSSSVSGESMAKLFTILTCGHQCLLNRKVADGYSRSEPHAGCTGC